MQFHNKFIQTIYKYLYVHSGQTILIKDISAETGISQPTIRKYLKWLQRRGLITRQGKFFATVPL